MPKPIIRPNFGQIIFYEFFMKEHHLLHILADFHEKIKNNFPLDGALYLRFLTFSPKLLKNGFWDNSEKIIISLKIN